MKTIRLLSVAIMVLLITTCFSPLSYKGDGGNLNIVLGGSGSGPARSALSSPKENLRYDLSFHGPGGQTISRTSSWGETVSVQAQPGDWNVTVKAFDPSSPGTIKAFGEETVNVRAGAVNTAAVKMAVYTEVTSWSELSNAVSAGTYDDFIVIKNNFGAGIGISTTINVNTNKTVTIVADGNRTINRGVFSSQFFDISGNGRLVLGGSSLYTGTLTLDGSGVGINAALVDVNGGSFTMHSGRITGTNKMTGHGGGVNVNGGTFTMTGGSITGNTVVMGNGGGVYITGGGTFNLNSPAAKSNISGNSATIGSGPQVYVNSGTFKENGVSQGSY